MSDRDRTCPNCGADWLDYHRGTDLGAFCTACKTVWVSDSGWEVRER